MPNYQRRIVYLSDEQRQALFANGTITVNGVTIDYSENDMYVTPQLTPLASALKGVANGVAELDASGKVPASQLPSFVSTIEEYSNTSSFPAEGDDNTIYVALDTHKSYRWGGSSYVEVGDSLVLGESSGTAYRGDRGKIAYDHASDQNKFTTAKSQGMYKISTTAEGHIASATPITKDDIMNLGIADALDVENIVVVQDETPTSPGTEVWFTETPPAPIQVPTYAEFSALEQLTNAKLDAPETVGSAGQVLTLNSNGELYWSTPTGGGGGSGGGTSDNDAVMTITNSMDWLAKTIRYGSNCAITFSWSSTIGGIATGIGTLKVTVNSVMRAAMNVQQGSVTIDVGEYLSAGSNTIRLAVMDMYGNTKTLAYTVTTISVSVSSSFEYGTVRTEAFGFPYTPVGDVEKTVHVKLDGVEQETFVTTISNRQATYPVPVQTHGAHSIELWFVATISGESVESNHIYYEYAFAVSGNDDPIIISNFNTEEIDQYSTVSIPYTVYDPTSQQCEVDIYEDSYLKATLTIGREEQVYTYRAVESGSRAVHISAGNALKTFTFTVNAVDINVEAETDGLQLYLSSYGRNNQEADPDTWAFGTIEAEFSGFNWASDGWQRDNDGVNVLRIAPGGSVTIPYQIFNYDFRSGGRTVELEFATRNVRNYNTPVISCYSGSRGVVINSQNATFSSEQSTVSTQFKDDEHVRLSFVVQKRAAQRLILVYINGIVSGTVRYPDNDDFSQISPVNLVLGGNDATLDIYAIRVYDHDLTRFQILNNWIADTQDGTMLLSRYMHNDLFDAYGNIVIAKLPTDLPYMVLSGALPTYKGNKLPISGEYVDPINPEKSFTFSDAIIDVQGTSSQYYARKNYKIKFSGGFTHDGITNSKYAMNESAIPVKTFTFKADVASSEGANNVELARLYNEACPYKTPYQSLDPKVRQGIDGFPIVIFHDNGNTTTFLGKYNFNNDKGTEEVFGFTGSDESWEIKNNTSNRVLWKSADYTGNDWLNDFEARYPEDNTDATNLSALAAWLVSTDQDQATGDALAESVTYTDGTGQDAVTTTYTNDTAAYRLAKFKHEIEDYMELDSIIFYYLFTELFLMVDSRAKNAFPSLMGGDKWCMLPYDFDTAIGINNEGSLTFSYNLEDTDTISGGADVFNGQHSVLWVNLRQAFFEEIRTMYQELRSTGKLSFAKVEQMFENHQGKWPEAVFNEDAQFKYLDPLINDNDASYLGMLQGSKEEQRKWWLYNRFRYIDSKYNAGDALTDVIQLRGYAKANITVTPYADIYPSVKYGSYLVSQRGVRNVPTTLVNPLDNVNDTEIYIYSCSQLASIGDISGLKVGFADFSRALKLQALKIGDSDANYENGNLTELYLGNNTLLHTIDVRNCTALEQAVDLSGCTGIENVYFDGTAVTSVSLPNGGAVKALHLPGTITNLAIMNQPEITDFTCPDFSNITTLRLENVSNAVDVFEIIEDMSSGSRIRLQNFHWELDSLTELAELYDVLDEMRGLDQNGSTVNTAQLLGTVHVENATGEELTLINNRYPDVVISYDNLASNLYYYDFYGNTLLHTETVLNGGNGSWIETPTTPSDTAQYTFGSFIGWSLNAERSAVDGAALINVTTDRTVYAVFTYSIKKYTATFIRLSEDGGGTLYTQGNIPYGETPVYIGPTPTSSRGNDYIYDNTWNPILGPITGDTTYHVVFRYTGSITRLIMNHTLYGNFESNATSVGDHVFDSFSNLEGVSFPLATSIGACAFYYCTHLTNASFPLATSIGASAFYQCSASFNNPYLPNVESLDESAFNGCAHLIEISLPSTTSVGNNAFANCSRLVSVSIPNLVSIGQSGFSKCTSLTEISFSLVTSIGDNAFSGCTNVVTISLPELVSAGSYSFDSLKILEEITLPSLTTTGQYMFTNCSALKKVSLPVVASLSSNMFKSCPQLVALILESQTLVTLSSTFLNVFNGAPNCIIYVPDGLVNDYKTANRWSSFPGRIKGLSEIPSNI